MFSQKTPAPALLPRPSGFRIWVRDLVLLALIGPLIEFIIGFLWLQFTGEAFVHFFVAPVYGHTSLVSPLIWGPLGATLLAFYRRYLA